MTRGNKGTGPADDKKRKKGHSNSNLIARVKPLPSSSHPPPLSFLYLPWAQICRIGTPPPQCRKETPTPYENGSSLAVLYGDATCTRAKGALDATIEKRRGRLPSSCCYLLLSHPALCIL